MNYWLTTHWPRPQGTPASKPYADVWAKDSKWDVIRKLAPGDMVFIYESLSGPLPLNPDGTKAPKSRGKAGIVALVRITEPASEPPGSTKWKYDNGQEMWWQYRAITESINSGGFIPREEFLPLIGYKSTYNLHGFGDNHSGLKQLTAEEFEALHKVYQRSAYEFDQKRVRIASRAGKFGGPGGEGDVHRSLKERIAADPAELSGEDGLTLSKMEFLFICTGDRIDVLLRDRDQKYVAVEVEVSCELSHIAGPLQCMKYRAMLAYLYERPVEEVRCILAAHAIAPQVKARCATFNVETRVVA